MTAMLNIHTKNLKHKSINVQENVHRQLQANKMSQKIIKA